MISTSQQSRVWRVKDRLHGTRCTLLQMLYICVNILVYWLIVGCFVIACPFENNVMYIFEMEAPWSYGSRIIWIGRSNPTIYDTWLINKKTEIQRTIHNQNTSTNKKYTQKQKKSFKDVNTKMMAIQTLPFNTKNLTISSKGYTP